MLISFSLKNDIIKRFGQMQLNSTKVAKSTVAAVILQVDCCLCTQLPLVADWLINCFLGGEGLNLHGVPKLWPRRNKGSHGKRKKKKNQHPAVTRLIGAAATDETCSKGFSSQRAAMAVSAALCDSSKR